MKTICSIACSILLLAACSKGAKTLSSVQTGMTKNEVIGIVGDPAKKNVVNKTEIWDYPDSNRTIIFRMDTVYRIVTSAEARVDSIGQWLDHTDDKVKQGLGNAGEKIGNAADKVKDKLKRDSTKK
jgi:outer membrane protein assembly factor BamE (lipoprotein component of BamABCDE complex)